MSDPVRADPVQPRHIAAPQQEVDGGRGRARTHLEDGARVLRGNIRNLDEAKRALQGHQFDAVVDWIVFTPEQAHADVELFRGRTAQYIFISSAAVYQTPPALLPPGKTDSFEARMDRIPALGEHTSALLAELGYSASEIERLRAEGAV